MKVEYKRFNFADLTVEIREREIEVQRLLEGNALYRILTKRDNLAPKSNVEPK